MKSISSVPCSICHTEMRQVAEIRIVDEIGFIAVAGGPPIVRTITTVFTRDDGLTMAGVPPFMCQKCIERRG